MEVIAGGLSASAACVFTNPMEVVKNRSIVLLVAADTRYRISRFQMFQIPNN